MTVIRGARNKDRQDHPHLSCSGLGILVEVHDVKEERRRLQPSSGRSRWIVKYMLGFRKTLWPFKV